MKSPSHFASLLLLLLAVSPAQSWLGTTTTSRTRTASSRLSAFTNSNNSNNNNIPSNVRLLILPGFGNESDDYYLKQAPVGSLVGSLQKRGWTEDQICVLPLQRLDWLQVFLKGALDLDFWLAKAPPTRPAFRWYLDRIATCIEELTTQGDDDDEDISVVIIGHSAGGWLARAALGFTGIQKGSSQDKAESSSSVSPIPLDRVLGMVTLGAPHLPPPPTVMDMTRGALRITHQEFPGAYHEDLFYITAIGNAVRGVKDDDENNNAAPSSSANGEDDEAAAKLARFAFNSYEAVCGQGDAVGDGVVPVSAGHLDGALQLDLDGIYHSIGTPERWYGSDTVIDDWHNDMLRQIQTQLKSRRGTPSRQQNVFTNPLENLFRR